MNELQQSPEAAGWFASLAATVASWWPYLTAFFWKFMPAPLGALVMVLFDMPKTRMELFKRLAVSYLVGNMFADVVFDLLHSFSLFSFLEATNRRHMGAVEFFTASLGWTVLAMWATWQRTARQDPAAAAQAVIDVAKKP